MWLIADSAGHRTEHGHSPDEHTAAGAGRIKKTWGWTEAAATDIQLVKCFHKRGARQTSIAARW